MSKVGVRSGWMVTDHLAQLETFHTRDSQQHESLKTRVATLETEMADKRKQLYLIGTSDLRLEELSNKLSQI